MGSSVITFQYLTYNHKPFCTSNTSWRFSINSTLLKENPLSTDACQWERVKTSLQTSQRFLYSLFLRMKSARNASVPFPFWLKIRKASLCWLWSMNHIEQHIFFLHFICIFWLYPVSCTHLVNQFAEVLNTLSFVTDHPERSAWSSTTRDCVFQRAPFMNFLQESHKHWFTIFRKFLFLIVWQICWFI